MAIVGTRIWNGRSLRGAVQQCVTRQASAQQSISAQRFAAGKSEIIALSLGLAGVVLAAKFVLLPFPVQSVGEFARWMLRLALVSAADVCFVVGHGLFWLLLHFLCFRRRRLHAMTRAAWFCGFYLAGVFGIASVSIYRWTMAPLTWQSLEMAGGAETFSSSITAHASIATFVALLAIPTVILLLPTISARIWRRISIWPFARFISKHAARAGLRSVIVFLGLIAAYGLVSRSYIQANWTDPNRWERRIAQSPHAVFLQSMVKQFALGHAIPLGGENADMSDFLDWDAGPSTYQPKSPRPKNVLVVVVESTALEYTTLARDQSSVRKQYAQPTTPQLAAAAELGINFENAYVQAPSSCKSLASITAGIAPRTDWWLLVRDNPIFAVPTIAEVLSDQGYRTCFAHSGYWSWKNRDRYLRARGGQTLIDADTIQAANVNSWGVSDRSMFDAVLDWIDEDPAEPFFALAYTIETHHPYVVREPEIDFGVDDPQFNRYLNALRETDRQIGRVLNELARRALLDDTLIVITADHGESFGQHNQRIHSFAVYEPAIHIPLVMLHPSLEQHPRRDSRLAQHKDIAPTILDMLDLAAPADWHGVSLFAENPCPRAYFFCTGNEIVLGIREGSMKYHYYVDSGYEELFDLAVDPQESTNLAGDPNQREHHSTKISEFRRRLAGFVRYQREFLDNRMGR